MSGLLRRLSSVEGRLAVNLRELPGVLEIHETDAWPACAGSGYAHCDEHAPTCGVRVHSSSTPGRHVIIREVPWLGV